MRLVVPQYLQALEVVAASDLLAVVPERLLRAAGPRLGVRAVDVPLDVGSFTEYVLHPSRSHTDPAGVWLRRQLAAVAAEL